MRFPVMFVDWWICPDAGVTIARKKTAGKCAGRRESLAA
jgi:hypothetical protein